MGNAKTTEFLKECLADALILLLKNKPIEKITIPEIAKTADVGRTTYFRNFTSKNEMLTFKIICLWNKWAKDHNLQEQKRFSLENANDFFSFNYSIRNLLLLLYENNLQSTIFNAFYQVMMPQSDSIPYECYESKFYSYGLFGLLDEWIKRGFAESIDEMANNVNRIIK